MIYLRSFIVTIVYTAIPAIAMLCSGWSGVVASAADNVVQSSAVATEVISVGVLLPDNVLRTDPRVLAWADAASEEGIRISFLTDAEFLTLRNSVLKKYAGIILPDQVHTKASDDLILALTDYASAGGWLMLVYDFGILNTNGYNPYLMSRLSGLAGIDYFFYEALRGGVAGIGPITGDRTVMRNLQVPPGKSIPLIAASTRNQNSARAVDSSASAREQIAGYPYGVVPYPTYVTAEANKYNGTVLLTSDYGYDAITGTKTAAGIAAGWRNHGKGGVLFVNTPLTYLNGRCDGMLLHGLLRYFSDSLIKLPRLSELPEGRGGLVFNWHVDALPALNAIKILDDMRVWDRGPFSIHFTAGPDCDKVGDGYGLNVTENPVTQKWIRYFLSKNHQVGSHGGWVHNLWGINMKETSADDKVPGSTYTYKDCLRLNKQAMESIMGRPVTEYSAPMGNNTIWSMKWLESTGHIGYYLVGHIGIGPTREYAPSHDDPAVGQMSYPRMWGFPVTTFGKYATFEGFAIDKVPKADISKWLTELVDFVVKKRTSRLIYAHPPGAILYRDVISSFLSYTDSRVTASKFRWYTMTDLAQFGSKRLQVAWAEEKNGATRSFEASHPADLKSFTWILPRTVYSSPQVISGSATITSDSDNWIVTANGGNKLKFSSIRD